MTLITCPACGRMVSTQAVACPQCGHPIAWVPHAIPIPAGPECYACPRTATAKCQNCRKLSCVEHLYPIYMTHGDSGAHELRCNECLSQAQSLKTLGYLVGLLVLFFMVLIFANTWGRGDPASTRKSFDVRTLNEKPTWPP